MNFGTNQSETETGGWTDYSNLYDPDREYQQRLMAYEMYGPQGVTGWDYNYYNPYQTGYATGPHWNYANNPNGPDPNKLGLPPGGIGSGGGQPNEVPSTEIPEDRGGGRNTRVVGPRGQNPGDGGGGQGQPPVRGRGQAIDPRVMDTSQPGTRSMFQGVGTNGGPGTEDNPSQNPNAGGPGGDGIGDPYADPDYYSNGPGGPGHASWINKGTGISGPMVRPADRDSNALYAGPFTKWGEGGASGNRQIAGGRVYDTLADIQDNPDLPVEVRNAMTTQANEAANAQYDSAEARLNRYGRTTGNRGGNAAAVAQLGTARADTAADVNRNNVLDFEKARYQRQMDATRGMGDLYQSEGNFLSGMFGARGALSNKPLAGKQKTGGHGNFVGTNLGFSIG